MKKREKDGIFIMGVALYLFLLNEKTKTEENLSFWVLFFFAYSHSFEHQVSEKGLSFLCSSFPFWSPFSAEFGSCEFPTGY